MGFAEAGLNKRGVRHDWSGVEEATGLAICNNIQKGLDKADRRRFFA